MQVGVEVGGHRIAGIGGKQGREAGPGLLESAGLTMYGKGVEVDERLAP